MTSPPVVVAVPARLESARLPGKVMADIGGQPMLRRVLERCAQAKGVALLRTPTGFAAGQVSRNAEKHSSGKRMRFSSDPP